MHSRRTRRQNFKKDKKFFITVTIIATGLALIFGGNPLRRFKQIIETRMLVHRYEESYKLNFNLYNSFLIVKELADITTHDINVKKLLTNKADNGDPFALLTLGITSDDGKYLAGDDKKLEEAANKSEPLAMALYGMKLYYGVNTRQDIPGGILLMADSANMGNYNGYKFLLGTGNYAFHLYCDYASSGYKKFGLALFTEEFLSDPDFLVQIQKNCGIFDINEFNAQNITDKILNSVVSEESDFIRALLALKNGEHIKAARTFYNLRTDQNTYIAANSKYCLSKIYQKGLGVTQNDEKSEIYLNSAELDGYIPEGGSAARNITIKNHPGAYICENINKSAED